MLAYLSNLLMQNNDNNLPVKNRALRADYPHKTSFLMHSTHILVYKKNTKYYNIDHAIIKYNLFTY